MGSISFKTMIDFVHSRNNTHQLAQELEDDSNLENDDNSPSFSTTDGSECNTLGRQKILYSCLMHLPLLLFSMNFIYYVQIITIWVM